jgi:hypothetical protein
MSPEQLQAIIDFVLSCNGTSETHKRDQLRRLLDAFDCKMDSYGNIEAKTVLADGHLES